MNCAECKSTGFDGVVRETGRWDTEGWRRPFHDEEGNLHNHKLHVITTWYNCTGGHSWKTSIQQSCWCGWPNFKEIENEKKT